jgi:heptaprenyl diphosphate synthase
VSAPATPSVSLAIGPDRDELEVPWSYTMRTQGKQKRASVLYAATTAVRGERARACDPRIDLAASAIEMCHVGALLHDDVVDASDLRRGLPSVAAIYGAPLAVATGGVLLGDALKLFSRCGDDALALVADAAQRTCAGQMQELRERHDVGRTPLQYFEAIEGKTAGLFWLAAQLGGLLAGGDATALDRLARFGSAFGMAFQIVDDLRDLFADGPDTGKPRGNDLLNGNYTLPVIYAMEERAELMQLLQGDGDVDAVINGITATRAVGRASAQARRWIGEAKAAVQALSGSQSLLEIADAELAQISDDGA